MICMILHNFAWMADELIVWLFWHFCRLTFLGNVMTKDRVHGVGHSPVCQILSQIVMRAVITSSPPAWTSSAGVLSTPANFPFFSDCTAASTSLRRMGRSCSVGVCGQFINCGSPLVLWLYSSQQYFVHRFSISHSVLLWSIFLNNIWQWQLSLVSQWSSLSRVCMPSYHCSSSYFRQSLTTVFSYLALLCLFRTPLYVDVRFPVFPSGSIFFFLSSLLLSRRSRISAVTQVLFFWRCLPRISLGCFRYCCVEGGDHWICVCNFIVNDGERCKFSAYNSLEDFQHNEIFRLFEVQLESCVFLRANLFQTNAEGHHQQVVVISKVCFWELRVLAPFTPDRKRFLTRMQSLWLWCCPFGLCQVHLLDALWWPKVFANTRSLKVANSGSLSPLSFVSSLQKGPPMPCQFSQASLLTFAFQSPCTTRMSFFGVWSMTFCSWS